MVRPIRERTRAVLLCLAFGMWGLTMVPVSGVSEESSVGRLPEAKESDLVVRRAESLAKQRAFPFGAIPAGWQQRALDHVRLRMPKPGVQAIGPLTPIGPAPIAFTSTVRWTGRVTALAVDPQNPDTIYLGAAQGGVWRSTDRGNTWKPLTDGAPTQAIGAIAIDPTNPRIIYAGTGEGNLGCLCFFGMGILKSTDGGQSWTNLAAHVFTGLSFSKLLVDPVNPKTLYAAVSSGIAGVSCVEGPEPERAGIYKSTDAGVTWTRVLQAVDPALPYLSAFDLEMDPSNSEVLYGAIFRAGIFKTTDGGEHWTKLRGGLPTSGFGRPEIGIARSSPNILYAAFSAIDSYNLLNLFKSSDGGNTWSTLTRPSTTCQCDFDIFIEVDPTNPDVAYFGGVRLYRTLTGGRSWSDRTGGMHVDMHSLAFVPGSPNQFYVGTDGGVWFSSNQGNTFSDRNGNLNITQFESISMHPSNPDISIGGTQDNGTLLYNGTTVWQLVDGSDGGFSAIDQATPSVMYHTYFNLSGSFIGLARSTEGGQQGTWRVVRSGIDQKDEVLFYAPFILDPNSQSTLYFGTFRLYRSTERGDKWMSISDRLTVGSGFTPPSLTGFGTGISTIAVAPGAPQVIYTGSSDGAVFATRDGGATFQNITGNLPRRYIADIVVDPDHPGTVYVSLSGFLSGHVFMSTTGGTRWQDISGNLPDVPANALAMNPLNPRNLFAGTDIGLFETMDGGIAWRLVPGMPVVSVFDVALHAGLGIVRVATHGRGVYEAKLMVGATPPVTR